MLRALYLLVILCLAFNGLAQDQLMQSANGLPPVCLTVEYLDCPVGIDVKVPRLSWKLPDGMCGQMAYEIDAGIWNSGRVLSAKTLNVEWAGPELTTSQRIVWKVRVWDQDGRVSDWSAPKTFVMGVMLPEDWRAKWIGPNALTRPDEDLAGAKWITGKRGSDGAVVLRRKVFCGKLPTGSVTEMVLTGIPQNEVWVNGHVFNQHQGQVWNPRFLRYRDVTPWLVEGENEIVVRLVKDKTGCVDDSLYAFLAKLTFPDGRTIVTDAAWEGAEELGSVREVPLGRELVLRNETSSPAFEKAFWVAKPVREATLHVTGVGFYEAFLNDVRIGEKVLDPPPTDFDDRVLYSTYLLEGVLRTGWNTLRLLVGHGWYDVRSVAVWNFENAPWRDFPCAIAQLKLDYVDGTTEWVVSDASWNQVRSPVGYDCIREGEILDEGGQRGTFRSNIKAEVVPGPKGKLCAENCPGAKVMREIEPESIMPLDKGTYVVRFPENLAGWIRLTVDGQEKGDVIGIQYDERLNEDGSPARSSARTGLNEAKVVDVRRAEKGDETRRIDCHFQYTASHRTESTYAAFQTDRWVCVGGEETYEPRFTYNGFRYVILRGLRHPPKKVVGCIVHTAFRECASFDSSDVVLNQLVAMAVNSYKSNFVDGYPTDCPHREKNGWTGDASVASELAQYLFENTAGYEKWLRDLCDTQLPSGDICCIAPTSGWGYKWGNGPAWDSALPVIAWNLYVYRDDRQVLDWVYPALKKYLVFTAQKADASGLVWHGLGDWNPVVREHMPSVGFTSSCYYYQALRIAAKVAEVKGLATDVQVFTERAEKTRQAVNSRFYKGDGIYDNASQTAQAMPIAFGIVEPSEIKKVVAKLVLAVERADYHLDVGLLGTKHVLRALSRVGRADLAYRMLTNPTPPSMVEWLCRDGSTLWEDWGDGASRNHIMFGDFAGWVYQYLAGIGLPERDDSCSAILSPKACGFREVVFAPCVVDGLTHLSAKVDTPYGVYVSSWRREDGRLVYNFTVPPGGKAEICLPEREKERVGPGSYERISVL